MDVPIWAVLLFFCGRFLVGWVLDRPVDSTVKVEEFPLLNVTEDSLDPETFQRLRNAVVGANGLASSKWSRGNQLNAGFKDTKGFVLRFNEEGVDDAFAGDFAPLRPFWQAVRAPEDNAFARCRVLNLVYVSAADCANVGDAAVALHIDETVGIDSARVFLAHAVSVLYLEAAVDTKGGRLELFANISYDDMAHAQDGFLQTPPDASVGPFPNRLAVFRGNAHHRVSRYCAASPAAPRVSLVLEAYRIEPRYYASTTKFESIVGTGTFTSRSYSTAALAKFRWQSGGVAAQAGHGAVLTALALVLIVAFTKVTAKKKED